MADICQEGFLRVYKNLDKFCGDSSYLRGYRITVKHRDTRHRLAQADAALCGWDTEDAAERMKGCLNLSKRRDIPQGNGFAFEIQNSFGALLFRRICNA